MNRLLWLTLIASAAVGSVARAADESPVGKTIGDFSLQDYLGARHSLSEWKDSKAIVVVFLGTECPLAKLYGPRLDELFEKYGPRGVQFVGIDANQQDTLLEIKQYARTHKISFPLLKDAGNKVADQFGAVRTPEAFLLDGERVVRYWGRIDDQYGIGYARAEATRSELATAIDQLLEGREITRPVTEAVGCHIGRVNRESPSGEITYSNQIARLLQKHCVRCHRAEQIAPFELTSYDEVIGWAETMREVIEDGRMPPWHANPDVGHFSNDASLTDDEKRLFYQWVENGLPEGDPRDAPKLAELEDGWQIGKPDAVFRMPQPFTVPAKGVVPYQYFRVDKVLEEDVWVRGAEVRPGNRAVVHHIFLYYLPPGQEDHRAEDPLVNSLAGYAPGTPSSLSPEGHARFVPAGSRLVFQVHYTPNGSEQVDQSEVGLLFADPDSVLKEYKTTIAVNLNFRIPPGAPNHRVDAGYQFTQDTIVHSLIPHMHYRGKSFQVSARYPDGQEEKLLDVPRYDFNWQNAYVLAEPKRMPAGTVLLCTGHFDNSADNLANPDPTKEVTWGDQTWDEMMLGWFVTTLPESDVVNEFPKVVHVEGNEFDVTFRYRPPESDKSAGGDKNADSNEGPDGEKTADAKVASVHLAGSFNGWNPKAQAMDGPDEEGFYHTTLRLARGQHQYKFVVNGQQWTHDPDNRNQTGPFNNSVVRVRPAKK